MDPITSAFFMQYLAQMDPQLINQMAGASTIPGKQQLAYGDMARGQQMQDTAMPTLTDAGAYKVAPSPWQYLDTGFRRVKGGMQYNQGRGQQDSLLGQQQGAMGAYGNSMSDFAKNLIQALRGGGAGAAGADAMGGAPPVDPSTLGLFAGAA